MNVSRILIKSRRIISINSKPTCVNSITLTSNKYQISTILSTLNSNTSLNNNTETNNSISGSGNGTKNRNILKNDKDLNSNNNFKLAFLNTLYQQDDDGT
ncbi:unconventional myosin heavy chain [Tieghemostelium lacteum]|uniref:Unconventional myosin heavy chain n=1 Tax=Tieghemostelium lacteum TaxID=361077 RepID=A0A152A8T4_TIELA|nr:unconventional myosin heavy chain [Tieghemostelium lacteum]|eukprot:KYR02535.1 unconventional myosin heavy chain [Tieghemostelium lacteum]